VLWEPWPLEVIFGDTPMGNYAKRDAETTAKCIRCGVCESKCPYELPIREMIAQHVERFRAKAAEHSVHWTCTVNRNGACLMEDSESEAAYVGEAIRRLRILRIKI